MCNTKLSVIALLSVVAVAFMPGCYGHQLGWESWFDPSKPVKSPEQGTVNPIFTEFGPGDQTMEMVPNATLPVPKDIQYTEEDYVIGPTDVLRITVLDLLQDGLETPMERQVSHSGFVDLLLAGSVKATGLTKDQLTERIKDAYRPDIIKDPNVTVMVMAPRQNVFSILGAVARPGTYGILRRDFTLLEALALCGDVNQVNIRYAYVYRSVKESSQETPSSAPMELPPLPVIPSATTQPTTKPAGVGTATTDKKQPPSKEAQLDELARAIASGAGSAGSQAETDAPDEGAKDRDTTAEKPASITYKWVYENGRWVSVPHTTTARAHESKPAEGEKVAEDRFGWGKYDVSKMTRIIAVDLKELKNGDPSVNIIIRDKDIVHIPNLEIGEFYVMGEVLRPGVYNLTGRDVTVKMAVAAAGNLGPLAWPNNSILIRRIGRDKEQTIPLKLQDIFHGREPDVFLKPNDVIAVGSYWAATPLAVWRNAFRMTYGFGFIYDRNYSEYEFEIPLIAPKSDLRSQW
ncbi:MAG: polysaccharide biosynthesis/export family protein [Phycisphaerae bacterium]|nr:polysaccharide biosynthesis/export family protein [Phycisphaerae bacterium]